MARQWKIRITGELRQIPDIGLLAQAVLLLAEDLQCARGRSEHQARHGRAANRQTGPAPDRLSWVSAGKIRWSGSGCS